MDAGKQQIVFYFIEEAKEHLDTLQQGLLDLRSVMADPERVNEMFRAAHSVKGGAAMLGFDSIKTTAHRLEDCFSILKNHPVKADDKMESMFLKGYDTLQILIDQLQGPFGLREDEADKAVQEAEPNFQQLLTYLNALVSGGTTEVAPSQPALTLPANFATQVTNILRQMLQLFRQKESPSNRQQIQDLCHQLLDLGVEVDAWKSLVEMSQSAIAHPQHSYRALAPAVIKDLKQACDLLLTGHADAIAPSSSLQQLANGVTVQHILVPMEPQGAAKALMQAFNKQQLSALLEALQKATR